MPITVGDADVSELELVPLPTKKVTGRIIVRNGSIPHGILGFYTDKTYVGGNDQSGRNLQRGSAFHPSPNRFRGPSCGLLPGSVKVGSQDMTRQGIVVENADVSDVVITVNAPTRLASIKGKITGLSADKFRPRSSNSPGRPLTACTRTFNRTRLSNFQRWCPGYTS